MKKFALLSAGLLMLVCGCSRSGIIEIEEQGSFTIAGTVLRDSLGHNYHGDHAYVFYQKPVDASQYPIVFAHGIGQFSKTWESTPDGREGFQNIFLRKGYTVYNVNQPRRGDAGRSTEAASIAPVFDEEVWFNRFRLGVWPEYFNGVQFSRDSVAYDQFFRQITPNIGTIDIDLCGDAYAQLFDQIGPAIFMTHSQGGSIGWNALLKTKNIKGIVALEPGGEVPFPTGHIPKEGKVLSQSGQAEAIEVNMKDFKEYTKLPIIIYYGDYMPETDEHPEQYEWTLRLNLMRRWVEEVNKHGGDATLIHLPEIGIHGNTHFIMSDLNNVEIADMIAKWLHEKGLDK